MSREEYAKRAKNPKNVAAGKKAAETAKANKEAREAGKLPGQHLRGEQSREGSGKKIAETAKANKQAREAWKKTKENGS